MKIRQSLLNGANPFMAAVTRISSLPWDAKSRVQLKDLLKALRDRMQVYNEVITDERIRLGVSYDSSGTLLSGAENVKDLERFMREHSRTEVEIPFEKPLELAIPDTKDGKKIEDELTAEIMAYAADVIAIVEKLT